MVAEAISFSSTETSEQLSEETIKLLDEVSELIAGLDTNQKISLSQLITRKGISFELRQYVDGHYNLHLRNRSDLYDLQAHLKNPNNQPMTGEEFERMKAELFN